MATTDSLPPAEWPDLPEPYTVDQLLDIIVTSTKLERTALTPDATLDSLNIASLDMVDILFAMEENFNVYIPMGDELSNVTYVADLVELLSVLIREGTSAPGSTS
ncbi:acyl carrier protein [Novosphingobium album (ex Hu et al. 2023)]|uniref:Phosphopantetheine-binding protein n=1 Tax=Novosphingobium album (ex Hu et al. 2023) TaxID=2930093 RepID=A0ABT0B6F5_9SPHN|nr:phosphopantetheine-binding protein [Novosphingobium album (ex Hu et al. 2023)]MCJ2180619.1 phosphopantetheine-binding protein [Novosphingobium album (ex Hu et al. 2023)]